jgi:oligopeptidase B
VGTAPHGWKADVPRQSESSTNSLVDPPYALPDPYGWLRDESRTDERVLNHLKAENAYTQALTAHLEDLRKFTMVLHMVGSSRYT